MRAEEAGRGICPVRAGAAEVGTQRSGSRGRRVWAEAKPVGARGAGRVEEAARGGADAKPDGGLSRARGWTLSLRLGKTHRAEKWLGCDEARPESPVMRAE